MKQFDVNAENSAAAGTAKPGADGAQLDASAQALLEFVRQQGNAPLDEVTVEVAREQSNALRAKLQPLSPSVLRVEDGVMAAADQRIPYRFYRDVPGDQPVPLVVFFHGGGFVLGDLDSHDIVCRLLCKDSGCAVLSVDYRRAPEHKFPAAVDDAVTAMGWVMRNTGALGVDPGRLALAGDSAGANLATVVALSMKEAGEPAAALQLLLYPVTDQARDYDSKQRYAAGYGLSLAAINYYARQYFSNEADKRDWRASPILHKNLAGLPETLIITAGFDPLVDEGEAYALRLAAAGVRTTLKRFPGQIHGFVSRGGVIPQAQEALDEMTLLLRDRFFAD